jgi:CrcB protein
MLTYLWVALGGALGSVGRFWLSGLVGTLVVNVSGSLVIGFLAALSAPEGRLLVSPGAGHFLMIGVCGGYTTFSAFSLQTLSLLRDREWFYAGGNVLLSVGLCMIAVWLGYVLGAAVSSPKGN